MNFNVPATGITALVIVALCIYAYVKGNTHSDKVNNILSRYETFCGKLLLFFVPMFLVTIPLLLSCLLSIVMKNKPDAVPYTIHLIYKYNLHYIIVEVICLFFLCLLRKAILSKFVYGSKETDDAVLELNIALACIFVIFICCLFKDYVGMMAVLSLLLGRFLWFGKISSNSIPAGIKAQKISSTIINSMVFIVLCAVFGWGSNVLYQNTDLYFGIFYGLLVGVGISLAVLILLELCRWRKSGKR